MSRLGNGDLADLTAWRRRLHAAPDLSGEEQGTAAAVVEALGHARPDRVLERLGGWGVAALFAGVEPGPTVMLRAELDALPIQEHGTPPHRSARPGWAHLCGHDGHMATLLGLALRFRREPPRRGRVWLLFQPAEETGAGAAAVMADPRFDAIAPDYAFAIHNLPGVARGEAIVPVGPANCASVGLRIALRGRTAHASSPETGVPPTGAVSELLPAIEALGDRALRPDGTLPDGFAMATVTHARLGEPTFGVAPGEAEVFATLRTLRDGEMALLRRDAEAMVEAVAARHGLRAEIGEHEAFRACTNDPEAARLLRHGAEGEGLRCRAGPPLRASEDFGRFGERARAAMLFLGAGTDHPALHDPRYDFPDELIGVGVALLERTARMLTDPDPNTNRDR